MRRLSFILPALLVVCMLLVLQPGLAETGHAATTVWRSSTGGQSSSGTWGSSYAAPSGGTFTWRPAGQSTWTRWPGYSVGTSWTSSPRTTWPASPAPRPAPQPQPQPQPQPGAAVDPASEEILVNRINQARVASGLAPLAVDPTLRELARRKSLDMVQNNYFGHDSPTWGGLAQLLAIGNVHYIDAGENLAGGPTPEAAHQALMNSPAHRANILNPHYTHVGVGVVRGGPYGLMVTELFVGR